MLGPVGVTVGSLMLNTASLKEYLPKTTMGEEDDTDETDVLAKLFAVAEVEVEEQDLLDEERLDTTRSGWSWRRADLEPGPPGSTPGSCCGA